MELGHLFYLRVMNNLYRYKPLKYGFIILCFENNIEHLKNTITSIDTNYPEAKTIIVLSENCKSTDKFKKTYKGGSTTASLINTGIKNSCCDWNFLIFSKGWINNRLDIKYSYFVETEKDILFPATRSLNFIDSDINGLFIHKKTFLDIGNLLEIKSLHTSKIIWATTAIEKGYKLKGIVGVNLN